MKTTALHTSRTLALSVLAIVSIALVACGGDEDGAATSERSGESANGAAIVPNGEGGTTISVATDPEGGIAYTTDELTAKAGDVRLDFTNPQQVPHDIDFEDANGEIVGNTEVVFESTQDITMKNLAPGDYTYFCSVPGHREDGMEGTLTVE